MIVEKPNKIKYVGKTKQKIKKRIHDHVRESFKLKTKKDLWIQSVINDGNSIDYIILEECDKFNWSDREKEWINKLEDLTNTSSGGDGGRGLIYTLTYEELKEWVHENLNFIKSSHQWRIYVTNNKIPNFVPKHPKESYKKRGWVSWEDFLKNHSVEKRSNSNEFFTYLEAKEYINKFNITSSKQWKLFLKNNTIDDKMPSAPDFVYSKTNEWVSWGEFLNTGNIHNRDKKFLTYSNASNAVKILGLKNYKDWEVYIKENGLINGIPRHPQRYYKKHGGWCSWCDFLS